jgi:hypothetical protein
MQRRWYTQLSWMTLVGILTLTGVGVLGFRPAAHAVGGGKLEGTWLSEIKAWLNPEPEPCPPPPSNLITFQSMTTYMRGGTLIEGGGPPAPAAVSRSAGHGIWERTGPDTFRAFLRFHAFDDLGRRISIVEVNTQARLIEGDNLATPDVLEPYYLSGSGTNRITILNPVDGSVINVIYGCSEATGRPFFFED